MINLPFAGHTNPTLPLTRELVSRGHRVVYINAESFRSKIEQTGAQFVPYCSFPANPTEQQKKRLCFRAAFETAMALNEPFDLLIYEMFFYPGIDIARRKDIPCVRQFSQPAWNEQTWRESSPLFKLSARLIDMQMLRRADARRMGLSFSCLRDGILSSRPELNVVYVSPEMQNHRGCFGKGYRFLAPASEAVPCGQRLPYECMQKPIVYISLGSIISSRGFLKECIRAFGHQSMSVILNTGRIAPASLGKLPANIFAYSFVPQLEVLSHADVFLTHCGMNSVNEALYAGVPMVAMPFINDQPGNARMLEKLGLARRVRSFPSRGKELLCAVNAVLHDETMKQKAIEMKETLQRSSAMEDIIRHIEALVP